ncbi:hypothetical protein CU098_008420, partial [Rhizopus stolonifer]
MSSTFAIRSLSNSIDQFPLHQLFPTAELDHDLKYIDKTYYDSTQGYNNESKLAHEKQLSVSLQSLVLNKTMDFVRSISHLDLRNVGLFTLPSQVTLLTRLTLLDLSHNKLVKLPSSIDQLKNLRHLNLSYNELTQLPSNIYNLERLDHLNMSFNPLKQISASLACLFHLTFLDLSNTHIHSIPVELLGLSMTIIKTDGCNELKDRSIEFNQRLIHNPPKACSSCGGPYFQSCVIRYRIVQRQDDTWIPAEYRLCSAHWNTEDDRLLALFSKKPSSYLPSSAELCQLRLTCAINVPSSNLSFENQIPVLETTNQERLQQSQPKQPEEQPKKKKRQHIGYACRERRVGCDRGKPICGQCKGRHHCQYSNHALRLDNVSMRQRLDELENQVSWLTSFAKNLEQDYRATVPRLQTQAYPHSCVVQKPMMDASDELTVACRQETDGPSVYDWAIETGWPVIENADGMKSIFTKITKHTFTLFESLNRYTTAASGTKNSVDGMGNNFDDHYLETDVMARLIYQHHQCGFPILVSPSRFENHYRQGQLKPLVLSSVFSHAVPHACIYHPHLAQIQQFRELGNRFYNHSHDLLGIDEPANLSNIHQRTLLITYDLDLGRVRRAFLHIGIAIRMCFMLNLHRPEGYVS